jgi:hypothetical protein
VIVDNDSSDGSCELLLQQPDVDVYHAAGSYERQEASGCCMSMPTNSSSMTQCEQYPLPRLVEHLEAVDHTRRLAPMTDLYRNPDRSPDLFFDGVPEHHQKSDRGSHIEGALSRYRTAVLHNHDAYPCLTKYPLALYGARTAYANNHFPYPTKANRDRIFGRLLHLKLGSHFRTKGKAGSARSSALERLHRRPRLRQVARRHDRAQHPIDGPGGLDRRGSPAIDQPPEFERWSSGRPDSASHFAGPHMTLDGKPRLQGGEPGRCFIRASSSLPVGRRNYRSAAQAEHQGVGLGVLFPFALRDAEENNPSTVRISSQRDRKRWVRLAVTGCVIGR